MSSLNKDVENSPSLDVDDGPRSLGDPPSDGSHTVDWDGEDDPNSPLNWSPGKKWTHIILVALLGLIPNMATTICAPGTPSIVQDLHITSPTLTTLAVTIYLVGLAFGPLLLSSTSEIRGRLPVYHLSIVVFLAFIIGNALSQTTAQFMVFRVLSGCAGGLPLSLGGGTIADLMPPAERGLATALFSLGPLAGPVVGPLIGAPVSATIGWRWSFWILAILAGAVGLACAALMRETSAKALLELKAARLRKTTGDAALRSKLQSDEKLTLYRLVTQALVRPTMLLLTSPIVLALSTYAALVFGVIYLLFTTFDAVFQGQYRFSQVVSGLPYLGLGIALILGVVAYSHLGPRLQAARTSAGPPKPEGRLLPMIWFSPLIAVGLFLYGWTAEYRVQWIVPIIGTFFIGFGAYFVLVPSQLYLIEMFGAKGAASALSGLNLLRYMGGAFLPLAGPALYRALGYGWGNTLLGFLSLAFVSAPILFYKYGDKLRSQEKV